MFYLLGNAAWSLFSAVYTKSGATFINNAQIFGKVYFPRLTVVASDILVAYVQFIVQFAFGGAVMVFLFFRSGFMPTLTHWIGIPAALIQLTLLGYGFGLVISSFTIRYRDLNVLLSFSVRLWMYITPVVYPLSQLDSGLLRTLVLINPVTAPMEFFRWCLWGKGEVTLAGMAWSWAVTLVLSFFGTVLFHRVERTFMDTV